MEAQLSLKGCFPPIPTPFNGQGRIAHDRLELNLEKWQTTPLAGFVVLGSNGEAVLLRVQEKLAVRKTARAAIRPKVMIWQTLSLPYFEMTYSITS